MRRTGLFILAVISILYLLAPVTLALPTHTSSSPSKLVERDLINPSEIPQGHNDTIVCVYPISGQYGLLPRLLYYISLILGILGRYQRWLVMGALASALSYAGSTAIHMLTLAKSRAPVFDLDIVAAWAVLTTGCVAFAALVHWSSALRRSEGRIVILLWGALVGIGCLTGRALIVDVRTGVEPACRSPTGDLLTSTSELVSSQFNCTYKCFSAKTPMRQSSEIMALPTDHLLGTYANLGVILLVPILAATHKSLSINLSPHTPSYGCTSLVMVHVNSSLNMRLSQTTYNAACRSWYGGYILLFQYIRKVKFGISLKNRLIITALGALLFIDLLFDLAALPMFVTNIIFNELNLMKTELPVEESHGSVGQWSPVVSAVLILIASVINRSIGWWKRRRQLGQEPAEGEEAQLVEWPNHQQSPNGPVGYHVPQENGVVMRKLTQQETLRLDPELGPKPSPQALIRERTPV
ncbi:predicted protein [Uncinocarpus reesii 1704]|uniref:Uncharacterized protein n=1 Tax=Uncinocarpus reesii (strain UAMH 1704) TaxID=336963 RepID=C4JX88_UNCRE|nr:uncharacterized protein UREG_06261 [Uncinocarpus reesii 1704]EEP81396.1 predicted protein [Uncinocarpus reesii 1704]